jgi:protein gp37
MGDKTGIQWTEATWNPTTGCEHVSPGCDNCYAASLASGRLAHVPAYAGLASGGRFNGTVRLLPERLDLPLRWTRPRMIFVNSMSDLFHKDIPDEFIAQVFGVMGACPRHTFQVLTKRHARMRSLTNSVQFRLAAMDAARSYSPQRLTPMWPFSNVWLGVSAEDQHWADIRIPALLDAQAVVRFVSAEPLLGPIDFTWLSGVNSLWPDWAGGPGGGTGARHPLLNWVIVGGESGPRARPMHPAWARTIRDDCEYAEVAFFLKQWGEWGPAPWRVDRETGETVEAYKARAEAACATHVHTGNCYQQDGRTVWHLYEPPHKPWSLERTSLGPGSYEPIRRWGKKAAGRELDGREWNEFPRVGEPVPA